jgi:hypothetical protein
MTHDEMERLGKLVHNDPQNAFAFIAMMGETCSKCGIEKRTTIMSDLSVETRGGCSCEPEDSNENA